MSGLPKSLDNCRSITGRQVQLAGRTFGKIDGNNARNFISERLNRNYTNQLDSDSDAGYLQGCHFKSTLSKALAEACLWSRPITETEVFVMEKGAVSLLPVFGGSLNGEIELFHSSGVSTGFESSAANASLTNLAAELSLYRLTWAAAGWATVGWGKYSGDKACSEPGRFSKRFT